MALSKFPKFSKENVRIFFVGKCPRKTELMENVLDNLTRLSSGIAFVLVRLG